MEKLRRVVIKVGTSSVTEEELKLSKKKIRYIVDETLSLKNLGVDVLIVSSGAIAAGVGELGLKIKPRDLKILQATAAVGQNELMKAYGKAFARFGIKVAQVLLTREDFTNRKSYLNIKNTLTSLLKLGVVPIINENDSVSVDEIIAGDNDNLAAIVAVNLSADALVQISDTGFRMNRGDKQVVPVIPQITEEIRNAAGGGSSRGRGGMASKIMAAEKTMNSDVDMFIVGSKKKGAIKKVLTDTSNKNLIAYNSTLFPSQGKLTDREHWLLFSSKPSGSVFVDSGAKKALKNGGSLLPSGITKVSGSFKVGDVVTVLDDNGMEFSRGIVNHSKDDVKKIMGKHTREIEKILGRKCKCEVVYRGNMVFV